jgi:hypothetical protein
MPRKFVSSVYVFASNPAHLRLLLGAALMTLTVLQLLSSGHAALADGGGGGSIP